MYKTIIRIEHPDSGRGIFQHENYIHCRYDELADILPELMERHSKFPSLWFDKFEWHGKRSELDDCYCAFLSIDQINQWITPEEIKVLISEGFEVLMLDVSVWGESEHQVIFAKHNIIQSKNITSLFEEQNQDRTFTS